MSDFDYRVVSAETLPTGGFNLSLIIVDDPIYAGVVFEYEDIRFEIPEDDTEIISVNYTSTLTIDPIFKSRDALSEEETENLHNISSQLLEQAIQRQFMSLNLQEEIT